MSATAFADDSTVGWITKTDPSAFTISRDNRLLPKGSNELRACDVVTLVDSSATVHIVLSSYQRIDLDQGAPHQQIQISCNAKGVWQSAQLVIARLLTAAATAPAQHIIAATRGGGKPDPIKVPALGSYNPMLIAGDRSLFIAWTGGVAPYRVRVSQYNGLVIAEQNEITGTNVMLPAAHFEQGRYSLVVLGADGHGLKENNLTVVDPSRLPPRPSTLDDASLSQADRILLYSYYLEGLGNGEWTLEALQKAASINPPTPASSDWIVHRFSQSLSAAP